MLDDIKKAEKLALAKRKLKEFESRKLGDAKDHLSNQSMQGDGRNSVMSNSSIVSSDLKNGTDDEKRSTELSENGSSVNMLSIPSLDESNSTNFANSSQNMFAQKERERFMQERDNLISSYENLKGQMQELQTYYSQLHSAYSQLTAEGSHLDNEKQIIQLQSAIAVMVEEKASLNRDLRKQKEEIQKLQNELELISQEKQTVIPVEPIKIDSTVADESQKLLKATNVELECQRRLTAESQANLLAVQHERSEAQARVKLLFREKEELEKVLAQTRKDLQMKEIYLKQLSSHQPSVETSSANEEEIENLHAKVASLENDIELLKAERDTIFHDLEGSRRNYEQYSHELSAKASKMESDLDFAEQARLSAELRVAELESQLSLLAQDMEQLRAQNGISSRSTPRSDKTQGTSINEEDHQKEIRDAVNRTVKDFEQRVLDEKKKWESILTEKDRVIFERDQALTDALIRLRNLEERSNEGIANESELLALSEQLQHEKATVSRAVAQNKELKQLLLDTEDRLVSLTDEKLQCELARQTAEHMVKELTRNLSEGNSSTGSEQLVQKEQVILNQATSSFEQFSTISEEDKELRSELEKAQRELVDMRSELRRSQNQNQEMNQIMMLNAEDENQNSFHVELGQAVNRITVLSAENEQLRETVSNLTQKILIPEHVQNDLDAKLQEENNRLKEEIISLNQKISYQNASEEMIEELDRLRQENAVLKETSSTNHISEEMYNNLVEESQQIKKELQLKSSQLESLKNETSHEVAQLSAENQIETAEEATPCQTQIIGTDEWARSELEKKFSQAMRRNAELEENMERVEHINVQLQLENDTIADHVVLYQHQRRLIRERLRSKDVQLSNLEAERQRVMERCQELQEALMKVLNKTGNVPEEFKSKSRENKRRASRTYSHSTVDELSGDEEVVVTATSEKLSDNEDIELQKDIPSENVNPVEKKTIVSPVSNDHTDPDVKRILSIINDLNVPLQSRTNEKLQCTQCIGELQNI